MTFTLHVEAERWRAHASATRDAVRAAISRGAHHPSEGDLVPVAKGNGYGLGNDRLTREATRLGLTRIAVGTVFEAAALAPAYDGDPG
jgi:alanine racemase